MTNQVWLRVTFGSAVDGAYDVRFDGEPVGRIIRLGKVDEGKTNWNRTRRLSQFRVEIGQRTCTIAGFQEARMKAREILDEELLLPAAG